MTGHVDRPATIEDRIGCASYVGFDGAGGEL
jgi:hypothetical protein